MKHNEGFTLIELMVAVAVLGITASIASYAYIKYPVIAQSKEVDRVVTGSIPAIAASLSEKKCTVSNADEVFKNKFGNLKVYGTPLATTGEKCPSGCKIEFTFNSSEVHKELSGKKVTFDYLMGGKIAVDSANTTLNGKYIKSSLVTTAASNCSQTSQSDPSHTPGSLNPGDSDTTPTNPDPSNPGTDPNGSGQGGSNPGGTGTNPGGTGTNPGGSGTGPEDSGNNGSGGDQNLIQPKFQMSQMFCIALKDPSTKFSCYAFDDNNNLIAVLSRTLNRDWTYFQGWGLIRDQNVPILRTEHAIDKTPGALNSCGTLCHFIDYPEFRELVKSKLVLDANGKVKHITRGDLIWLGQQLEVQKPYQTLEYHKQFNITPTSNKELNFSVFSNGINTRFDSMYFYYDAANNTFIQSGYLPN